MALAKHSRSLHFLTVLILALLSSFSTISAFALPVYALSVHPTPHQLVSGNVVSAVLRLPTTEPEHGTSEDSTPWVWFGPSINAIATILSAVLAALVGSLIAARLRRRTEQHRARRDQATAPLNIVEVDEELASSSLDASVEPLTDVTFVNVEEDRNIADMGDTRNARF